MALTNFFCVKFLYRDISKILGQNECFETEQNFFPVTTGQKIRIYPPNRYQFCVEEHPESTLCESEGDWGGYIFLNGRFMASTNFFLPNFSSKNSIKFHLKIIGFRYNNFCFLSLLAKK